MAGGTSLARQLAALRTPGVQVQQATSVYNGPFLFPEAEQNHSSLASLKEAVADSLGLLCSEDSGFGTFAVLLECEAGDQEMEALVTDCLYRLCPHLLLRPAQYVLQWLVTKHKVHIQHPALLVFTLLPHHSYHIYQTTLDCLDDTTVKQIAWLTQFKQTCVPTNQRNLHKQVATNPAFLRFLCEQLGLMGEHLSRHPDTKVHKQTTLAMAAILGGLQMCGDVGEERLHSLLQIVLSGFKSNSSELAGLSSILLGYILPRVVLREKAVTKVCKALSKYSKHSVTEESLCLALLLARTQPKRETVRVVELVCQHQPVINSFINEVGHCVEQDTADRLDSLVYSLAVLADNLIAPVGETKLVCSYEECTLLSLLAETTALGPLTEETAEMVAKMVVGLTLSVSEDDVHVKEFKHSLTVIGSNIERWNPVAYQSYLVDIKQSDILFVPGKETPTSVEIDVARLVASDPLINFLSDKLLLKCCDKKSVKKIIKKNKDCLDKVLTANTGFLLSQLEIERLQVLLLNLLKITGSKPDSLHNMVLSHLCTEQLGMSSIQPVIELILLPILIASDTDIVKIILESQLCSMSPLLSLLSSLCPSSSMFSRALTQKLSLIVQPEHIRTVLCHPILASSSTLTTLLLRLSSLFLSRPEQAWVSVLTSLVTRCIETLDLVGTSQQEDIVALVVEAREVDAVSWTSVIECITAIANTSQDTEVMANLLRLIPVLHEKAKRNEALELSRLIQKALGSGYLDFLMSQAMETTDYKLIYFCLHEACSYTVTLTPAELKAQGPDELALQVIFFILSPNVRVQKQAFDLLPTLSQTTKQSFLKQLADFFTINKTEIVNNLDNFETILEKSKLDKGSCSVLLSNCIQSPVEIFIRVVPFFDQLTSKKDAENLSKLGLSLLQKGVGKSTEGLAVMATRLTNILITNFSSPLCSQFITGCLSSSLTVEVAGLTSSLSKHFLRCLALCPAITQLSEVQVTNLLSIIMDFAVLEAPVEAKRVAVVAALKPTDVHTELKKIWGDEAFTARGKTCKPSIMQGLVMDENEAKKWTLTCWLLETVETIVQNQELSDWSLLTKPIFVLLKKVADMELEECTYKLNLLLGALHKILFNLSTKRLQDLDSGQLEPELLVFCIRTSPNPDTRNTALQVLARCAVSNPDFILQNSITIFTFMGSHLLQVDSRRSFQVACEALDVLVPAIKSSCMASNKKGNIASNCLSVLTTFVDASKDIPSHRLTEFMMRLVKCLGDRDYLWVTLLLLAKKDKKGGDRIVTELLCKFEPCQGVEAILRLMVNLRNDNIQLRKMFGVNTARKEDVEKPDDWDMLRLRSLQLTASILCAALFKNHVSTLLQEEQEIGEKEDEIMEFVNLLIEATILTIEQYTCLEILMPARLKKNLVAQAEKVLELSLSLLPSNRFLQLASDLLSSKASNVRLRALEVVSSKLSPPCTLPMDSLPSLMSPLIELSVNEEHPHAQQLALLAVRQLAKLITDPKVLIEAATAFSCSFLDQINNPKVLGAAVLTCGDVLSSLGPLAVTRVPLLVKWLLNKLEISYVGEGWTEKEIAVVHNSFLYCLQKLIVGFVGFINPMLGRLICVSSRLAGQITGSTSARAKSLLSCLATTISPGNTLTLATSLLETIWTDAFAVPPFVNFVAENCRRLERNQLSSVSKDFVGLFTLCLGYRVKTNNDNDILVDEVEEAIISAFLSVALRLCLEDFKPVYQRLVTQYQDGNIKQLVTIFNLTVRVAEKLKSLFSFGVESIVMLTISSLATERPPKLVGAILSSMTTIFTYNKLEAGTLSLAQYERLVTALLPDWLLPCPGLAAALSQLAASTIDDTNWKFLHYQLLMVLRDPRPSVRISVLLVLEQCVTDRTDTYLPVLPDAVPFLQEILEDDDQAVEIKCKDFIQHMETTFGQNIESYFV